MTTTGVELTFRRSYGKLLAALVAKGFDPMTAEDALSHAFSAALQTWDTTHPVSPEAWLLTVANRRAIDLNRKSARLDPLEFAEEVVDFSEPLEFPVIADERLRLFFLCTHPAIAPEVQTPLMLQLLSGLSAETIAGLYLVPAAQISQRLVRAKRKIRDANIAANLPEPSELGSRAATVMEAIYGLYSRAWDNPDHPEDRLVRQEAIGLARSLAFLLPDSAEAQGLLSLLLLAESRQLSRLSSAGQFVPLAQQDPTHWDWPAIAEGERALRVAAEQRQPGRFQLEAAIQSAHISRVTTGGPDWEIFLDLYTQLVRVAPTAANHVGRLAVIRQVHGPQAALDQVPDHPGLREYQPFLALLCHLYRDVGEVELSRRAGERAIALTSRPEVQAYLRNVLDHPAPDGPSA